MSSATQATGGMALGNGPVPAGGHGSAGGGGSGSGGDGGGGTYREPARFGELPATRLVPPPTRARRVARQLLIAFVVALLVCVLAPWIQNVQGSGRVVAYSPIERQQILEAPVTGRVVTWWVQEGSHVTEGDPVVEIVDNDPELLTRLRVERAANEAQLQAAQQRVIELEARVASYTRVQETAVEAAEARVRVAQQRVEGATQDLQAAEAAFDTAKIQQDRQRELFEEGLVSSRDRELADLGATATRTALEASEADLQAAESELASSRAELARTEADTGASLEAARAALRAAESDVAGAQAALARIDVRLSRQQAQRVHAPRDGTILRLLVNQGGEQVSQGEGLVVLVPDTVQRAVELWVDGNDAAIIRPGREVRLQFEGWPALQFSGWPSVAVGTFGGRVAFVDSADNGTGDFRLVVLPDEDDEPWPPPPYLRQGVRANGWVLLDQVPLGFELWRQFNGFPPSTEPPPPQPGAPTNPYPIQGSGGGSVVK